MATKEEKNQRGKQKNSKLWVKKEKFNKKAVFGEREKKWEKENKDIEALQSMYEDIESSKIESFADLPLSWKTQKGLKEAGYMSPTDIQREAIGLGLKGNDILGAAKTGSGKTLAFLIPVLECLYRKRWTKMDGLGALIITPTRELAYQIFEVLRKMGLYHDFSAGLVIGGKHLREEAERINNTSIVICTPGRLLQHMDQTINFSAENLQVFVLDEADRILDLGFQQSMNAIIENLPRKRQTLLFSATQTKSVKDLARLSLKDPMYVSVHENSKHSTPAKLEQSYMVCELHEKIDVMWSFVKNHIKSKILIFLSSCKQVRFVHEIFRRLRPGVTVLALHGAMQQLKRVATYEQFCRKQHAVLFATDIAARGLDFPAVHWVVQMDCPEDANTYIHRAGRTARYEKNGEALLLLTPSEEPGMLEHLTEKKIPINKIKANPKRLCSIQARMESLLASDVTLKEFAQRAFVSYVKSVYFMSDKKVFGVQNLDTDQYSKSLGLAIPPRIRFLQKKKKVLDRKRQSVLKMTDKEIDALFKNTAKKDNDDSHSDGSKSGSDEEDNADSEDEDTDDSDSLERIMKSKRSGENLSFDVGDEDLDDILQKKKGKGVSDKTDSDSDDDQVDQDVQDLLSSKAKKSVSKFAVAKKLQKKNIVVNTKVVFDEEGEEVTNKLHKPQASLSDEEEENAEEGGINIQLAQKRMQQEDIIDKQIHRERVKKIHKEKRLKEKESKRGKKTANEDDDEVEAVLDTGEESTFNPDDLPDPDANRGSESEDSEAGDDEEEEVEEQEDNSAESDDDSDDDRPPRKKMRRAAEKGNAENSNSDSDSDEDESKLSLADQEALALQLLS